MVVLNMVFEMTRQIVNTRREQRDLYFRGTGVGLCPLMVLQNLSLLTRRNRHHLVSERKGGILLWTLKVSKYFRGLFEQQLLVDGLALLRYQAFCRQHSVAGTFSESDEVS